MNVILYMAMSLNGYIAEENGSEDFLSDANWKKFCDLAEKHGNFVVGRKTYEAVKNWNEGFGFDDLKGIKKVIISQDENYALDEGYVLAASPKDALEKLRGFDSVLVTGGSTINTAFMKEGLLDEVMVNIEPALIGKGIPLFAKADFLKELEFVSSEESDGIVSLHYRIGKGRE
jgi:dihydrofolate reductase